MQLFVSFWGLVFCSWVGFCSFLLPVIRWSTSVGLGLACAAGLFPKLLFFVWLMFVFWCSHWYMDASIRVSSCHTHRFKGGGVILAAIACASWLGWMLMLRNRCCLLGMDMIDVFGSGGGRAYRPLVLDVFGFGGGRA
ncbi:hypothetical protein U1Q18_018558 [Sarracenia purpurea var. burkii]